MGGSCLYQVPPRVREVDLKVFRMLDSLLALVRHLRRERPKDLLSAIDHANLVVL